MPLRRWLNLIKTLDKYWLTMIKLLDRKQWVYLAKVSEYDNNHDHDKDIIVGSDDVGDVSIDVVEDDMKWWWCFYKTNDNCDNNDNKYHSLQYSLPSACSRWCCQTQ